MKALNLGDMQVFAIAAAVGGAAWVLWKGASTVGEAVSNGAINPASPNNVAARSVNAVGAAASGDDSWNLGSRIFELMNPSTVAAERALTEPITLRPAVQPSSASLLFGNDLQRLADMGRTGASTAVYEQAGTFASGSGSEDPYNLYAGSLFR